MRINLAKLVPGLGVLVVIIFWSLAQHSGGDSAEDYDTSGYDYYSADTSRADAYLDALAVQLAQPGLFADPAVLDNGDLDAEEVARLDRIAADTAGPVRVAVIPADAVRVSDDGYGALAYAEDELVAQLYDRVGVDGTYAILVDASSSYSGRSFTAYQWSEERPYYEVQDAVDTAVDCCAPDYDSMLATFLEHTDDEQTNPWPVIGWVAGRVTLLLCLFFGGRAWLRRRRQKRDDAQVADMLRPALQEEVVELSTTVAALPAAPAGDGQVATATRQVLDLVEEARHRLDGTGETGAMDTPSEVEDVVQRLSDARYQLTVIAALRQGQPVPERTAPCFFDPRHGPSVAERPYTPEFGMERPVPVCTACRDQVDAGQVPAMRTFALSSAVKPYWQWDRYSRPYVNGYWQRRTFADPGMERQRFGASPAVLRHSERPRLQFVWESDSDSGGSSRSGGGGGSRSFSGRSSSRRSFGGGSSSRSSRRSGGSRKF
jgi:hypothetical protein